MHALLVKGNGKLPPGTEADTALSHHSVQRGGATPQSPRGYSLHPPASPAGIVPLSGSGLPPPPFPGYASVPSSAPGALPFSRPLLQRSPRSPMVGSMTKIRVALIDTADSHWLPSPREPSGYELFARVPPLPNGAVIPPSAVATPSGAVVAASAATPAAAAAPESAVKSEAAAGGAAASSSSAADPSVDDTAMAEAPAERRRRER